MKTNSRPATAASPLRRRAETRLQVRAGKKSGAGAGARSAADAQRLLHELQVHQIELEMQNEELKQARDEMEAGLEKYSELYDFAPVGYLTIDRGGAIREANLTAASLLGIARTPLMTQRFGGLVAPADRPRFHAYLTQVFERRARTDCDVRLLVKGEPAVDVRLRANLFESEQACRMAVTDVTEHKLAEDQVRVSEVRFRRLFEAAHDGVLLIDPATCKITDANPFMTQLLGYRHAQLVGKELFEIGLLQDEAASREMFQRLKRKHEVRYEDLPLKSQAGRHQEVEVVANLYQENGHAVIQCNIRDITERKLAEHALVASEERYRSLFNSIDEGFCVIDLLCNRNGKCTDYRFVEVNPAFAGQLGLDDALGKRMREIAPALEEHWFEAYGRVAATGRPMRFSHEAKPLGRWFDVYAFRVGQPGSRKVAVLFRNITVRKQTELALALARTQLAGHAAQLEDMVATRTAQLTATNRRLETAIRFAQKSKEEFRTLFLESQVMQRKIRLVTHQILTAQEEERKKISRELHDVVVQTLVGINVELTALVHRTPAEMAHLKDKLAQTQRLVESSVDAVHGFARELRPAVLDDLGLIPALHAFCRALAERKKIKIKLTAFGGVEAMDGDKRTVMFRVAQEALGNVARHARATHAELLISKIPGAIRMEIRDNGQAFPVAKILAAKNPRRLGLVGMKERVEMIGGAFTIMSKRGVGTTVCAEIPFDPPL
jgi:PAS domain S-box-containing protein